MNAPTMRTDYLVIGAGATEMAFVDTLHVIRTAAGTDQPPGIGHRELGHSPDLEMLEDVMPVDFRTEDVASVVRSAT